jgi:hypothetical protein
LSAAEIFCGPGALMRNSGWLLLVCLIARVDAGQSAPIPELLRPVSYVDEIQPLFRSRCIRCHGPAVQKGQLNLSSRKGIRTGGENGTAVVPSSLDQGTLWNKIQSDEMPPDQPLTAAEKDLVRRWIEQGAAGTQVSDDDSDEHWAFRPLSAQQVPVVQNESVIRSSIDRFIQARLEEKSLTLSAEADRLVQIRRVSFDVTGLPPSPDEIREYVTDTVDGAYERMADRYLASPQYGERWGKHWLDAAGYADSNGYFSADTDRPLAWRYRDYVIRSINADKPLDRFLREQLAGDELAVFTPGKPATPETIELLEATHFLRNGQDGSDIGVQEPEAFEIDRRAALEAAVQVTASSLLGLTLHCARCHDHKFEPISQREYYQFQAILFPAFNPQDWVNPQDRVVYAFLPGEDEQWARNEKQIADDLAALQQEYREWMANHREPSDVLFSDSFDPLAPDEPSSGALFLKERWSATAPGDDQPSGLVSFDSENPPAATVKDGTLRIHAGGAEVWLSTTQAFDWTPDQPDAWIQATFDLVQNKIDGNPAERIGYSIAAYDFNDSDSGEGSARNRGNLLVDGNPTGATTIYRDYPGPDSSPIGSIGEQGYAPGRNYGIRITRVSADLYRVEHRVDGLTDGKSIELKAADLTDGGFAFFYSGARSFVVDNLRIERSPSAPQDAALLTSLRQEIAARHKDYTEQRKQLISRQSPQPGRAIAWVTDKSGKPPEVPLLTRGQYHLRGELVDAAVPQMLSVDSREYRPVRRDDQINSTGRRTGFATWLTQPNGRAAALVCRVCVNRVWARYFGRGIVSTTDNLGQSGAVPSHPELLDYLAGEFQKNGWSSRWLHRQILNSAVYRQSGMVNPEGLQSDPDNRLLWHWPVRRLDAESIRDGMLRTAGILDRQLEGPYVPTQQTSTGEVVVDVKTVGGRRRSVYLQQRRSQTLSLLKVFDAPSIATVCSSRPSSTVPLQSLALLNSEFAVNCAESLATRILAARQPGSSYNPKELVLETWQSVFGCNPGPNEEKIAVAFLDEQRNLYRGNSAEESSDTEARSEAASGQAGDSSAGANASDDDSRLRALADLCQMILASNAYLYLE